MPHVIVKLYAGRSDRQKVKLAAEITKVVISEVNCAEESVSVSIEDIPPSDWTEKIFKPDIVSKLDTLFKKPGYSPL